MQISSQFDGGNITCHDLNNPQAIKLSINKDHNSDFLQWFYFRATGLKNTDCKFVITNAGETSYTKGWEGYKAVASYDRKTWFRVSTEYDGTQMTISHKPEFDSVFYAYFAPYTMEQHHALVAATIQSPLVAYECLGQTLDGQDMDHLVIGNPKTAKRSAWVIARQHPGETMAEWFMEGWLQRMVDQNDPISRELLRETVFYVVPNMNPDGSKRGHLRTNAVGTNLNREWQDPSLEKSPEVYLVLNKMKQTGVDFCLDVHGDEALPYNFIAGAEGVPNWNDRLLQLQNKYKESLKSVSPDFQTTHGYPVSKPGSANLTVCTQSIAQNFQCLAMTLEMPFKDTKDTPNEVTGWSPERCRKFGAANVDAMYQTLVL